MFIKMNQKLIAGMMIAIGITLAFLVYFIKTTQEAHVDLIVQQTGTCFLEDGTCLHEQGNGLYIAGWAISGILVVLGIFLLIDKSPQELAEMNVRVTGAIKEAKETDRKKEEWKAFLSAFTEDEQKALSAIREQDGIQQSTLRYRTGLSKSTLSQMLKGFEDKGYITRQESGKTNKVFMRKVF
jgi:hypothetical protein